MAEWLHVDLCTGLGGWKAPFEASPDWRSVGIDVRDDLDADVVADVRALPLREGLRPQVVTTSPPCGPYSSAWNAVKPPAVRYPDFEVWNACVKAIADLEPEWCVLENVAQAQYWHGPSDKHVGPFHLWGRFPPFDAGLPDGFRKTRMDGDWSGPKVLDSEEAARIPYTLANALRKSVEVYA